MSDDNIKNLFDNVQNLVNNGNIPNDPESLQNMLNNISPEMLNGFKDILNSSNKDFSNNSSISDTTFNSNNSTSSSSNNSSSIPNIDINTILKMKSVVEQINQKDDPRANLLHSLKPYLRDSKKGKIDQYVNFLNMSKIADIINLDNKKDDNNCKN
jgi:hypothetical protein